MEFAANFLQLITILSAKSRNIQRSLTLLSMAFIDNCILLIYTNLPWLMYKIMHLSLFQALAMESSFLAKANGHSNGSIKNGYSKLSNGHMNGHANGKANGVANGYTNGHANGHANGSLNSNGTATQESNGHIHQASESSLSVRMRRLVCMNVDSSMD